MDDDLKLVEHHDSWAAAATITRLHAEIEALKSDVSDLVRAGSDEATENERLVKERDELRLAICGGEDAPGHNASLSHETILKVLAENYASQRDRAETAEAQRDAALEALRPFAAAFEHGVTELPDDIWAVQTMRSRVGFYHFRAASRTLEGVEPFAAPVVGSSGQE